MINSEKTRKKVGYVRVSTDKQDTDNQILEIKKAGVAPADIYEDAGISGTIPAKKRKEFKKIYDMILKGEVEELYVYEISRLGRTSSDAIMLFIEIEQLGTRIKALSPHESWTNASDDQAFRNVLISMAAWFADIERRAISERTKISVQARREKGEHIGRDFKDINEAQYKKYKAQGMKIATIARVMQIPTATMYRFVKRLEDRERIERNTAIE
jgi:DNA invertase Pin-like site-specific DNA recombinase